ncbi:MAG: class I SAM-dependent methyltransferase [Herpetosiphonaceae bacterium]|nr:class I SAM-dependent methyltransferase [Herpetosiphonaceae bacterium]
MPDRNWSTEQQTIFAAPFAYQYLYSQVIQWSLRRLYNEFAWSYDLVAALVSRGYWSWWIAACLPLLEPGLTLELGCGTGYLQRALALRQLPHVGLDRSAAMLHWARHKVAVSGSPDQLVCGDTRVLPVQAHVVRNVVATFPAPYVLERSTLQEIKRVLQPDGQFLIIDNGLPSQQDAYAAVIDLAYRATMQSGRSDPRPALLRQAGWIVREQWIEVEQSQVWVLQARLV